MHQYQQHKKKDWYFHQALQNYRAPDDIDILFAFHKSNSKYNK